MREVAAARSEQQGNAERRKGRALRVVSKTTEE